MCYTLYSSTAELQTTKTTEKKEGDKLAVRYMCKWFIDEESAVKFQKEHGGVLYKNVPRSRTKKDHLYAGMVFGFDAEKYPYSVNWNESV